MTPVQTSINPDLSLVDVAHLMLDCGAGFLPVVEDDRLVGVITDRDLVVRGLAENRDATQTPVRELMSIELVCGLAEQSLEDAKALMEEHRIRRLPVIDEQQRLVGVLSRAQLQLPDPPHKDYVKVTFNKTKTDSYGRPHPVKLKSVYITGTRDKDAAVQAALKRAQQDERTNLESVSDKIETESIREGNT
ncbi:MAG: CBS domain-containing protein [Defluviicoccus sp.]|nr:MAG: CBS domain-containing protein [Defluviicoccus sp.]